LDVLLIASKLLCSSHNGRPQGSILGSPQLSRELRTQVSDTSKSASLLSNYLGLYAPSLGDMIET